MEVVIRIHTALVHFLQLSETCFSVLDLPPPLQAHFRDNLSLQFPLSCIIELLIEYGTERLSDEHHRLKPNY